MNNTEQLDTEMLFSCHCIFDNTSEKTDSRLINIIIKKSMFIRSLLTVLVTKNFNGFLKNNCYWKKPNRENVPLFLFAHV